MSDKRNDVTRLMKFSLEHPIHRAMTRFPMFSAQQIVALYAMSLSQRKKLLADRLADDTAPVTHRSPAQVAKLREIGTDPSNR